MTMRVLITGGCGFLGHHLVEHLLKNTDYELVVVDKLTYASAGLSRLREIRITIAHANVMIHALDTARISVIGCDLAQPIPEGVAREIGDVDYIIHAAAESHVDNSITDPMPFLQSNVIGTHHLLWFARSLPRLKRIFCVSTDEVYGPASWDHPGHDEESPFRPANPYAAAKAGGEAVAMAYANTYKLPVTIVNTMNLIGERQGIEKFVPMVIRKVRARSPVVIHADPSKTRSGTRFYIHCRNFASALLFLIERDHDGKSIPLKLHVGGEREISNLDLAKLIAATLGLSLNYELVDFHSSRPGHDLRYALKSDLIRSMGWQQPFDIEESLARVVRWSIRPENLHWLEAFKKDDK